MTELSKCGRVVDVELFCVKVKKINFIKLELKYTKMLKNLELIICT